MTLWHCPRCLRDLFPWAFYVKNGVRQRWHCKECSREAARLRREAGA